MNRFPLLLAYRYLRGAHAKRSISTMVLISSISIAVGSGALMLVLAIMHGFEVVTYERLQSIHSPIIIRAWGNQINMQALAPVLEKEFPEIEAFSPSALEQVIIRNPHTDDVSTVVGIKGIEPETISHVNTIATKIKPINGVEVPLAQLLTDNHVIIGEKLAESLDVAIGDTITLLFAPDEPKKKHITLNQQEVVVSGLFSTGIEEFDVGLIFGSLALVDQLFPESGITQVQVKLQPYVNEQCTLQKLRTRLKMEVYTWKDLYPALVSALKLEKYVMFIILALICLVASMNIISLIFMQIQNKLADIALLRAFGMNATAIRHIFLCMGGIITAVSSTLGILCAIGCALFLQHYPFITLPDAYFVTHLPVKLEYMHILLVWCCSMLLSLCGILIPLRRTQEIDITEVLRHNV